MQGFGQVSPLRIEREVRQSCQILRIAGIFDLFSVPTFRKALERSVAQAPQNFILDFTAVDLIDSLAVGALIDFFEQVRSSGGTLQIIGGSRVARVIKLLRLEQFLSLQTCVDTAIENLEKPSAELR